MKYVKNIGLIVFWVYLCSFPSCTGYFVSPGIFGFDFETASDANWVGIAMNDHLALRPVGSNMAKALDLPWDDVRLNCGLPGAVACNIPPQPDGDIQLAVDSYGRWWISQIVYTPCPPPGAIAQKTECISVSATTDPTGGWYHYLLSNEIGDTYVLNDGLSLDVTSTNVALVGPFQDAAIFHAIIFDAAEMRAGATSPNWGVFTPTGIESLRPAQNTSGMQANLGAYDSFTALFGPSTTANQWYMAFVPSLPIGSYGTALVAQEERVDTTFSGFSGLISGQNPDGWTDLLQASTRGSYTGNSLWIAWVTTTRQLALAQFNRSPFFPSALRAVTLLSPDTGGIVGSPALAARPNGADDDVTMEYNSVSPTRYLSILKAVHPHGTPPGALLLTTLKDGHPWGNHWRSDFNYGAMGADGSPTMALQMDNYYSSVNVWLSPNGQ